MKAGEPLANADERQGFEGAPAVIELAAKQYKEHFAWADEAAMEISLLTFSNSSAQSAALARSFSRLGFARTRGRYTALRLLYFATGPLKQNEMRTWMNVTPAAVTYLIDELEKQGLVRRSPHPVDRRALQVELTDEGRAACEVLVPEMARFMAYMCRDFSEAEKEQFKTFLQRFHANASRSYVDEGDV